MKKANRIEAFIIVYNYKITIITKNINSISEKFRIDDKKTRKISSYAKQFKSIIIFGENKPPLRRLSI